MFPEREAERVRITAPSSDAAHATPAPRRFGTTEVARLLNIPQQRVRAIVQQGACRPRRAGRTLQFNVQDLVVLRTLHGLLCTDVPPRRARHAPSELE